MSGSESRVPRIEWLDHDHQPPIKKWMILRKSRCNFLGGPYSPQNQCIFGGHLPISQTPHLVQIGLTHARVTAGAQNLLQLDAMAGASTALGAKSDQRCYPPGNNGLSLRQVASWYDVELVGVRWVVNDIIECQYVPFHCIYYIHIRMYVYVYIYIYIFLQMRSPYFGCRHFWGNLR